MTERETREAGAVFLHGSRLYGPGDAGEFDAETARQLEEAGLLKPKGKTKKAEPERAQDVKADEPKSASSRRTQKTRQTKGS